MAEAEPSDNVAAFDAVPVPRRDRIPPTGFSSPSDVTADPEITRFVPESRAGRLRLAAWATAGVSLIIGAMAIRLIVWTLGVGDDVERKYGIVAFFFLIACAVGAALGIRAVFRWAIAPDPRDAPHRL